MSYMFIANFELIGQVTLVLEPENRSASWRKKRSQSKTAQVLQKIFHTVVSLKIPFHINQPIFGRDEFLFLFFLFFLFFSFFFLFFFLNLVRSSSSKPQNFEI